MSPIAEADPADPTRDPDEIAALVVKAYHEHVEGYLATTRPPHNTEEAVSSGLLGSPLLGTQTRAAADWCHAWSLLGQWSGWVTFPVPETGEWPRHGHLRGILDGCQGISGPTGVRTRSSPNPQPSPRRSSKTDHQKYVRDTESYLIGTANLSQPRFVEYTATSVDKLRRLYCTVEVPVPRDTTKTPK